MKNKVDPRDVPNTDKKDQILTLRRLGYTFKSIGNYFKLSRQRIQQLYKFYKNS